MTADYLIVGSGLTGGTIARCLADQGREVLVLERRSHRGGNVHDLVHPSGVRVHTYGPHYFRCSAAATWDFVNRFSDFYHYRAEVQVWVHGRFEQWPITQEIIARCIGRKRWLREPRQPSNFEEACLAMMPRAVYEAYIKGYTQRQWGMAPRRLDHSLANRVHINGNRDSDLTPDCPYQGLPVPGYAAFMNNLLAGLPCLLGVDYLKHRSEYRARKALIFTGPIDEFFDFRAGHLGYRSQRRRHYYFPHADWLLPCGQVNYPEADADAAIRAVEWKHLSPAPERGRIRGTLITEEYPFTSAEPDQFEYPMPTRRNQRLYQHYRARAEAIPQLVICGRLGAYQYLDMDQAIEQAHAIAARLCASPNGRSFTTPLRAK